MQAGYSLTVIEPEGAKPSETVDYDLLRVRPVRLRRLAKGVWLFLRRLAPALGEAWWTLIYALGLLLTALRYARHALSQKADVYQAHDLDTLGAAVVAGKLARRPIIYDAHELVSEQGDPHSLRNRFLRHLEQWLIPHVDRLLVPNLSRAHVYHQRYHLRAEPTVILNCPPRSPVVKTNTLRERLGLSASTRVVLYHGTLMAGRALEELVLAARGFEADIVLVIIGEQNAFYHDVLKPLWARERLAERVLFLPYVPPDEIMSYVASADLGVVIYKNINLNNYLCAPTKLYEYFMAGVPVVACDFPEMRSLLEEYPVGHLFDPDTPSSIADAVNEFLSKERDREDELRHTLSLARERFNWEAESRKLLDVFTSLASVVGTTTAQRAVVSAP